MKVNKWFMGRGIRLAMTSGVAAIFFAVFGASANAQTWNNAGGTGIWNDGANWTGGVAPAGIAADAIVGGPSPVAVNTSLNLNSLIVNADGVIDVNPNLNFDFGGTATTTLNNAGTINTGNNTDFQFQNTVVNSGQINVNATTLNTDIEIDSAGATLSGGGTITLNGANAGINGASGAAFTIVDQTINGQGSIGENLISIDNQADGFIDANVNGEILQIDANATGMTNAGTTQSSGGGILRYNGTVVDNASGLIVAQAGSEVRFAASSITGGTIDTEGSGQLVVEANTNVRFEDLANTGNVTTLNNSDTELLGTIDNSGTIEVQAGTLDTDLEVQTGDATLTGSGTVRLTGSLAGINGASGSTLTIGDQTIEGEGSIGENLIGVVNTADALVDANVAGETLQIDASTAGGVDNDGVIQSSDQGVLRILGSEVDNENGLIVAQDNSEVRFAASSITGGTIDTEGSGQLVVEANTNVRFEDLNNTGNVTTLNNSDTELLGMIDNSGTIEVQAGTLNTDLEVQTGDATLTGGGTVRLTGSLAGINGASGSTLTIGDQTIEGEGSIGENLIGIVNSVDGLVDANVVGQALQIDASTAGGVDNDGVLQASNEGILRFVGSNVDNDGGLIEAQADSIVSFNSSTVTDGTLNSVGTGVLSVEQNTTVRFEDVTNNGTIMSRNNSDTELVGTINNTGLMEARAMTLNTDFEVQAAGATLTGGGTTRLTGTLAGINGASGATLNIQDQLVIGEGSIGENLLNVLLGPSGTIEADVMGGTLTVDTAGNNLTTFFTNDGTLRASNGSTLDSVQGVVNNGTIEVTDGSLFEARTLTNSAGSLLRGEGFVNIDTGVVNIAGTVQPGDGIGTLELFDNAAFASTSMLEIELLSSSQFDVFAANELVLDGLLSVDLLGGFDPLLSDTFLIATSADGVFGEFSNVSDGGLLLTTGGEGSFTVNYLGNGVQLSNFTATAIPEPTSAVLLVGFGIGFLIRRRRQA